MARLVSLAVLTVLIAFLGITFYRIVVPFVLPLFLAATMAVISRPLFLYFVGRTHGRVRISAALTTSVVLATLMIPLLLATTLAALELYTLAGGRFGSKEWHRAVNSIKHELQLDEITYELRSLWSGTDSSGKADPDSADTSPPSPEGEPNPDFPAGTKSDNAPSDPIDDDEHRQAVAEFQNDFERHLRGAMTALSERTLGVFDTVRGAAVNVLSRIVSVAVGILMFTIGLYYFLADGPALIAGAEKLIPMHVEYQRELFARFDTVVRSIMLATFLAAVAQGSLTAIALSLAGFDHFFIILAIATFAALVPLIGTWIVWVPCAYSLASDGQWLTAIMLSLFCAIVVGTLDNIIRTYILQNDTKLHPLLALVSVLGGLQALGLWGMFIGPVIATCLHALVKIFNTELKELSRKRMRAGVVDDDDEEPRATDAASQSVALEQAEPDESQDETRSKDRSSKSSSKQSKKRRKRKRK